MTFLYSSNSVKPVFSEWTLNLHVCFPSSHFVKKEANRTSSYEEFSIQKKPLTSIFQNMI